MNEEQRTIAQNNSMHLYFKQVSDAFNEKGLTVDGVLKNVTMELTFTPSVVKELLWKNAQKLMYHKKSTTELSTDEVTKIWEVMNLFLAKNEIESIPFPSEESKNLE